MQNYTKKARKSKEIEGDSKSISEDADRQNLKMCVASKGSRARQERCGKVFAERGTVLIIQYSRKETYTTVEEIPHATSTYTPIRCINSTK